MGAFPYELQRNERNLGSNRTFELLTENSDGAYIAYCDQDDIWFPEKILRLYEAIQGGNSIMAYCDMCVIDAHRNPLADSHTN